MMISRVTLSGFLFGLLFIAVISLIIVIVAKKEQKKIDNAAAEVSPENLARINHMPVPWEENRNFLIGKSYVYEIKEENGRSEVKLLYYGKTEGKLSLHKRLESVFMEKRQLFVLGIRKGDIVDTLYNTSGQNPYMVARILGRSEEAELTDC